VENQHRQIKDYKELDQEQIDLMNEIKTKAEEVGQLLTSLYGNSKNDSRWLSIGKTHLQQGFMALTRGVTNPDFF